MVQLYYMIRLAAAHPAFGLGYMYEILICIKFISFPEEPLCNARCHVSMTIDVDAYSVHT